MIIVTSSLQYLFIKDTSICFLTKEGIFGGQLAVLILPHLMTILRLEWMRVLMGCNLIVFQCQMDPQNWHAENNFNAADFTSSLGMCIQYDQQNLFQSYFIHDLLYIMFNFHSLK